jgi:hypothetical protein
MEGDDGGGYGDAGETGAAAPAEGTRGAAVFEEGGGSGEGQREPPQPAEGPPRPQGPGPQGPQGPPPPTVDARQFAAEMGQVLGQHLQPPQRQISVEEAKKLLNVWEPVPEWLAKYDNMDTRAQALAELRDGFIRQADTITQYRLRELQEQIEERIAPWVAHGRRQEALAGEWRFTQRFPQLGDPSFRPLLFSVAQSMLAGGARFRNEEEMFNMLAKGVEGMMKLSNPAFSLEAGASSGGRPVGGMQGRPVGALPVTTPGSGGGSGNRAPTAAKPRGLAIFDP